jgi:serine/threonine protein kinase
LEDSLIENKLN